MDILRQKFFSGWRWFSSVSGRGLMSHLKYSKEHETPSHAVDKLQQLSSVGMTCGSQSQQSDWQQAVPNWFMFGTSIGLLGYFLRDNTSIASKTNNETINGWVTLHRQSSNVPVRQLARWWRGKASTAIQSIVSLTALCSLPLSTSLPINLKI